jgi:hypothetical protein
MGGVRMKTAPIVIEADIPDALQDDFREMLLKVPEQKNIGALVAFVFMAGVNAQRNAGLPVEPRPVGPRPSMSMYATAADYNAAMDEWLRPRGTKDSA